MLYMIRIHANVYYSSQRFENFQNPRSRNCYCIVIVLEIQFFSELRVYAAFIVGFNTIKF